MASGADGSCVVGNSGGADTSELEMVSPINAKTGSPNKVCPANTSVLPRDYQRDLNQTAFLVQGDKDYRRTADPNAVQ